MGFWGSGLYANDTTCDIRDSYTKLLQDEISNEDAYRTVMEQFQELIGDPEEPLLWLALAETQWRVGRLLPEVKEKALEWIDKGGGLELWEESKNGGAGWKKTLQNLRDKLQSPMPPEKKIRKPQEINHNLWNINDVYAYQFHEKESIEQGLYGKYVLIQKIGEGIERFSKLHMMRIHVLDRIFDHLPTLDDMIGIRILPLDFPTRVTMDENPIWMSAFIQLGKKSEYPAKYLTFIGNTKGPANYREINHRTVWCQIERWLPEFYQLWQGIEYETIEEGIYRYKQAMNNDS